MYNMCLIFYREKNMKKALLLGAMAITFMAFTAQAEVAKGKVVDKQGNMLTVQTENGQKLKMAVTDNTTYRKKKTVDRDMTTKDGRMFKKGSTYFSPMVDEDEWIELIYTPGPDAMTNAVVEDVVVYDD